MDNAKLGTAVLGGYVLGRTKKAKVAVGLGMLLAGSRMKPGQIGGAVARSPFLKSLNQQVRTELTDAGKAAATSVLTAKAGSLADTLHERTAGLREKAGTHEESGKESEESEGGKARKGGEADTAGREKGDGGRAAARRQDESPKGTSKDKGTAEHKGTSGKGKQTSGRARQDSGEGKDTTSAGRERRSSGSGTKPRRSDDG